MTVEMKIVYRYVLLCCFTSGVVIKWLSQYIYHGHDGHSATDMPPTEVRQQDDEAWTLCTDTPPSKSELWPTIGNGHLATVVHSHSVYMNGLYNGNGTTSTRARIPAMTSLSIKESSMLVGTQISYCLDMRQGIYTETYTGAHFQLTLKLYAHRTITRLLVTELAWKADGDQQDLNISLHRNHGSPSTSVTFTDGPHTANRNYMHGRINVPETAYSGRTEVHVYYTKVPHRIHIRAASEERRIVLMAVSPHRTEAHFAYVEGMQYWQEKTLESTHVDRWNQVWNAGRIDVTGNRKLATAVNSALYYIISSMPLEEDITWPFMGLSPADLAHKGYDGHLFWDQDTWMFPPILLLHFDLARLLVQSRIRTLDGSYESARHNGNSGAQYAWESAVTGLDVCPGRRYRRYELHVTGDVAFAFQQYLMATNDTDMLNNTRLKEAIFAIAEFWKSRSTYKASTDMYEILDVMPPDEWHWPVGNSVYTNYVAKLALLLPGYVCKLVHCTAPVDYERIANKMYIPFDAESQYHPEFDGYTKGVTVKQGDVILLGYPLQMPMPDMVRYNDLDAYEKATGDGPAMTWGMFAIGWLDVNETQRAERMFNRQLANMQQPFNIWNEVADGSGVTNFITGQGGFLQSVLAGYGGIRLHKQRMDLHCRPLPNTETLQLTGVDYLGNTLDVHCDASTTSLSLTATKGTQLYVHTSLPHRVIKLVKNKALSLANQRLALSQYQEGDLT